MAIPITEHSLLGKIVQLNTTTVSKWWIDHHYIDYVYRVEKIFQQDVPGGQMIAHLRIHHLIPGKEGKRQLEMRDTAGYTINAYVKDLIPANITKNIDAAQYLLKE